MAWWQFWRRSRPTTEMAQPAGDPTHRTVHGRHFAAGVPYVLPKDAEEINRLDFQHYMLRSALKGNYAAPLSNPRSILDVGCGTGRWAVEMATLFPAAHVTGIDVTTPAIIGVSREQLPTNFTFTPANILEGLPFTDGSFDFVHQRLLVFALPTSRWPDVARELVRVTRPGGWIELVEGRPVRGGGPALERLHGWVSAASERRGIDMLAGNQIGSHLQGAGLAHVQQREIKIPLGKHGGRLGQMAETDYFTGFNAIRPLIVAQGLAGESEFDALIRAAREDVASNRYMWSYFVAFGQRL